MQDNFAFTFIEQAIPVDTFLAAYYVTYSPELVQNFYAANAWLSGPEATAIGTGGSATPRTVLYPGEMVLLPPTGLAFTEAAPFYPALSTSVAEWNRTVATEPGRHMPPGLLNKYYDLVAFAASEAAGGIGAYSTVLVQQIDHIEALSRELEQLYVRTYNQSGSLTGRTNPGFFRQRQNLIRRLDGAFAGIVRKLALDPSKAKLKAALGLSSKSIVHQWKLAGGRPVTGVPGFAHHLARLQQIGRTFRAVGYFGIALDGAYSVMQINRACADWMDDSTDACRRTQYQQVGRFAFGVGGGIAGGAIGTYAVCNLLIGAETLGSSFIWCALVAGGGGAYAGGKLGGTFGNRAGQAFYETRGPTAR